MPTPIERTLSGSSDEEENPQSKGGLKDIFKRRQAKVGQVELDPEIDYTEFTKDGPGLSSRAAITDDGMINVWVDLKKTLPDLHKDYAVSVEEYATDPLGGKDCPPLSIVIFIVGSRGDVQPYISLALHLIKSRNHRVRIATHPDFRDLVLGTNKALKGLKGHAGQDLEGSLEYFDVGGDPQALMAYMVKNPGLLPGIEALKNGEIGQKRKMTGEMLDGFFRSVFSPDPVTQRPFAADAIISNPPAFAHVHIAEALGLPLHMSFTMPWSPSTEFSHPLVNVQKTNAEKGLTNYLTFSFADMMTWQGLGDVINSFRTSTLGLEPLSARSGPAVIQRLKVPWTFCWSEGLINKPHDWKEHIDVSGFYFLEKDGDFKPDAKLVEFLAKGKPPVYIGFGSVVVEDAAAMTKTIFEAVKKAGIRALVSAGWGGLGGTDVPDDVFILEGNIPHDWLFAEERVAAVCHHGGAGTTAIGLRNGLPTIVIPFFGDQKFWGDMIHRAGAGPEPIPHKLMTAENLARAIRYAVSADAKAAAGVMGEKIRAESGEEKGVESFHRHLPLKTMRCDLQPDKAAQWWYGPQFLRLSGGAAAALADAGEFKLKDLEPLRAKEYESRWRAGDPITGGSVAVLLAVANHYGGIAQLFYNPVKGVSSFATVWPQGISDIVLSIHDGFNALPGRLGSNVRERGTVKDFESGLREGGKGIFYGYWDGITGLVTEPLSAGKKEGAIGALKGMGRSFVNVNLRPAAGITGAVALPLHGGWLSLRKAISGSPQSVLRGPREATARLEVSKMSAKEKREILSLYDEAQKTTRERRGYYKKKAEVFLMGVKKDEEEAKARKEKAAGETSPTSPTSTMGTSIKIPVDQAEKQGEDQEQTTRLELNVDQPGADEEVDDADRKKMDEAEQRGYERAMKEMEKRK